NKIGTAERINGIGYASFMRNDLLRAQRDGGGKFGGQGPGFVQRICMQRLRAAEDGGERLQRGPYDVVVGLLSGERTAGGLRVEAQSPGAGVFGAIAFHHRFVPDAARGAILCNFLEKIAVRVEEKRKLRAKFVEIHSTAP